ncbi:MAG: hypothetical protein ACRDF0_11915 [Candidatus Limnocylindria bacterium]
MLLFAFGLVAGLALGVVAVGFLALADYRRGYADALERRRAWKAELVARHAVASQSLAPARKAS